jgi:predicted RNA-binding protein with PUA-like domain
MQHWLMKSEPDVYSLADLRRDGVSAWEGVRNYQARNFMQAMKLKDRVFFYHSRQDPPGIVGVCRVSKVAFPDHTAWDPESKYFDPKASPDNPRWQMVEVEFVEEFPRLISLNELKSAKGLEEMVVGRKGSRLSVQPVTPSEWKVVLKLAKA